MQREENKIEIYTWKYLNSLSFNLTSVFSTFLKLNLTDRSLLYHIRMIDIVTRARKIYSQKCQKSIVEWFKQKGRIWKKAERVVLLQRGSIFFFFWSRFKSEWSYRRAIVPSLSCVRRGSHTVNTRVENGLYRGECVRSVLVPIEARDISGSQVLCWK